MGLKDGLASLFGSVAATGSRLADAARDTAEPVYDLASRVRYGVSPERKFEMAARQELPGSPAPHLDGTDDAERYTSAYLGAQKWGETPARIFNSIALSDILETDPHKFAARKAIGEAGAKAGGMAAKIAEEKRRQRLLSLFSGQR
jgi:hypothetical protein